MEWTELKLQRLPGCPACGPHRAPLA